MELLTTLFNYCLKEQKQLHQLSNQKHIKAAFLHHFSPLKKLG